MSLNTEHKVTLTEAQISVILNSLDYTLDRWQVNGYQCDEDQKTIDEVYKELNEYNDNKERDLINQIEAKIYDLQEKELLRAINLLKG
jgi:hypothetical protein